MLENIAGNSNMLAGKAAEAGHICSGCSEGPLFGWAAADGIRSNPRSAVLAQAKCLHFDRWKNLAQSSTLFHCNDLRRFCATSCAGIMCVSNYLSTL